MTQEETKDAVRKFFDSEIDPRTPPGNPNVITKVAPYSFSSLDGTLVKQSIKANFLTSRQIREKRQAMRAIKSPKV